MTDEEIISIAVKTSLLNYIDNETPRRFFVSGHAELDDVVSFGRIIAATALQKESNVIRAEALEEAAKVADEYDGEGIVFDNAALACNEIAAAIRALKED